jgi:hypothetical protein
MYAACLYSYFVFLTAESALIITPIMLILIFFIYNYPDLTKKPFETDLKDPKLPFPEAQFDRKSMEITWQKALTPLKTNE